MGLVRAGVGDMGRGDGMTREDVIKGLECCVKHFGECKLCPYGNGFCNCDCGKQLYADAITLLKEQEPVSVQKKQMEMVGLQTWDWACGNCGQTVLFSAKYCPWCGRAVKWK